MSEKIKKSLAVRYRPKKFEDVVGQSNAVEVLQNQIINGNILNSYLFCGPSGCGKTTLARIFAKAINKGKGNIIELDAASNNGVDNIRKITSEAYYQALDSDYKVYIVDEAHGISKAGWEAFLKTLEEPPAKTIFILCTTNPNKLPATILNRVQRYNFQRMSNADICNRLWYIIGEESTPGNVIVTNKEAVDYICSLSKGGMRDAIAYLERCLSTSSNITLDVISASLNIHSHSTFIDIMNFAKNSDTASVLCLLSDMYNKGVDLRELIEDLLRFIIDCYKYSLIGDITAVSIPASYVSQIEGLIDYDSIALYIDRLNKLMVKLNYSRNSLHDVESTFIELLHV